MILARDNREKQKEPIDLRIFAEAAAAMRATTDRQLLADWLRDTAIEFPYVRNLVENKTP